MFIYQVRYQKLSGIKAYNIMPSTLKGTETGISIYDNPGQILEQKGGYMNCIGVLGGTGEIGSRILRILKEDYPLIASYHTRDRKSHGDCEYIRVDISDSQQVKMFCQKCDVVINCAGASYLNGENVARIAADLRVPYIDPSGEAFLEKKLDDIKDKNIFVLSSGYFPGMSGLLMRHICESFDAPETICGLSVSDEVPSQSAIEDFILTNLSGFGVALSYYNNGTIERDENERIEKIRGKDYRFQNYLTVETERVAKKYSLKKANWFNSSFGDEIIQKLQTAIIQYKSGKDTYKNILQDVIGIFYRNTKDREQFSYTKIEGQGVIGNNRVMMTSEISSNCSSEISAIIAAYAAKTALSSHLKNDIHYAMDIIKMDELMADMPRLNVDLNIDNIIIERGIYDEYEEGEL